MSNQIAEQNSRTHADADVPDIEQLARRFKDGDMGAFDELVGACESRVFNLAYRIVNNYDDATELTQDVFVKVYRSIGKFRGNSRFTTWLYSITANSCLNRLRRKKRISFFEARSLDDTGEDESRKTPILQAVDPNPNPSETHRRTEFTKLVENSIAGLPADFRTVIVMRDLQGMAYEEISVALSCSLGTVKSRLSRARNMTKDKLQRLGITPGQY